jgi:hypothetical protein
MGPTSGLKSSSFPGSDFKKSRSITSAAARLNLRGLTLDLVIATIRLHVRLLSALRPQVRHRAISECQQETSPLGSVPHVC